MKTYNPEQPLISIHTPKTAGTTLVNVLHAWFRSGLYRINQRNRDSLRIHRDDDGTYPAGICIHGHFNAARGQSADVRFPDIDQYITFLRDPLEHHLSMYYFKKERVQKRNKIYWDWGADKVPRDVNDFVANYPSQLLHHMPSGFSRDNYAEMIGERYVFIGLVEHMNESIGKLARVLRKAAFANLPHVNRSARTEMPDNASIEAFVNNSEFEYLVYNHVRELFDRL